MSRSWNDYTSASLFHINLHCRQSAHNCPDANVRWQVCEASAALADRLLADAEPLQHEPRTRHMYEKLCRDIIRPFSEYTIQLNVLSTLAPVNLEILE